MRIIDRTLQTIRALSVVEQEALRLFAIGKSSPPELLSKVRMKQHWLACDCQSPAPIMHVALRDSGRVMLKNNPDGSDHRHGCPFARSANDNESVSRANSQSVDRLPIGGHVALHSEFQPIDKGLPQQISRSVALPKAKPKATLSLLLTLMELAELDTYCPSRPVSLSEQYAAIRHAAGRFVLSPGIPLTHVMDTRISKQRLVALAKRLRETKEFSARRRYGVLLDVIQKTGPRQLIIDDAGELDFFGNAEALHGRSAPLLTLATVASQEHGSGYYQLGKVAFVPVLSAHQLFPVVDDIDRENVQSLFGLLRWLHEKKQIVVTASRSLFQPGAGYGISLRHGAQVLDVDLNQSTLDGEPLPSAPYSIKQAGSLDALKKQLAGAIIKGSPNV